MVEERIILDDGTPVLIRPAVPEDVPALSELFNRLSSETRYLRFMKHREELSSALLGGFVESQPETVALVAQIEVDGLPVLVADGRYVVDRPPDCATVAIVVQDAYQRKGLGHRMLRLLVDEALLRGLRVFTGEILSRNQKMLNFIRKTGYEFGTTADRGILSFRIELSQMDQGRTGTDS